MDLATATSDLPAILEDRMREAAKLLIGVTEEEIIFTVEEITVFGLTWKENGEIFQEVDSFYNY